MKVTYFKSEDYEIGVVDDIQHMPDIIASEIEIHWGDGINRVIYKIEDVYTCIPFGIEEKVEFVKKAEPQTASITVSPIVTSDVPVVPL